ncbi:helix-turn-helix transcriptional regulator [Halomonas kalidii]|uniref:Helix-turn-helix domain-containing protein n=1 Tax=Halomonas kalidii TaxID=3043293 RepID=A0ABT6VKE1_9GAMM|nr:helix-turn-helix domain-containing protein [Halomonas kalidii]MDI5934421.1 helix-turn-helix domain-containing protein [Halomonas kalidii]
MKRREHTPDEREARLVSLTRQLLAGEISEGRLLRTLRREVLGLSQEDYARLVGVSRRTLSDMEGDKGNISLAVMNRVYRPLGLRVGLIPRQTALLERLLGADDGASG